MKYIIGKKVMHFSRMGDGESCESMLAHGLFMHHFDFKCTNQSFFFCYCNLICLKVQLEKSFLVSS